MMKFKWTYLFIAVVVSLIGFTVYDFQRSQRAEQLAESEKRVLNFDGEQVTSLEIQARGEKRVLTRVDGVWKVEAPFQDSADPQAVATFLESLATEKIQEIVTEGEELDLKNYGLDQPTFSLTLREGSKSQTLKIGSVKAYDGSLFAQVDGQNRILLVSTAWDVYLSKPARELRDKRVYRREPQAVPTKVVLVSNQPGRSLNLEFEKNAEKVWIANGLGSHTLREGSVEAYVEKVKALRAFDYMSIESKNTAGLKSIGLEKPGYTITVMFENQPTPFELKFASLVGVKAGSKSTGDVQNIETLSSDLPLAVAVYRVAAQKVMVGPQEFFDPKAPFSFPVNEVKKIQIELANASPTKSLTFQKTSMGWENGLQATVDSSKLDDLVSQVSKLSALRFYDEKSSPKPAVLKSKLVFQDESGKLLFEMRWGDTRIEKAAGDQPEAVVLPVRTSKSNDAVGLPEASVTALGLEKL